MKQHHQADDTDLQRWTEHFHKITTASADKLFTTHLLGLEQQWQAIE